MIIEVRTFRLAGEESAFVEADKAEQHELCVRNRGLIRRTTARGENGEWVILTLWDGEGVAEEPSPALAAHIDPASVTVRRYEDLRG